MDEDARELDLTFPIPSRDGFMQAIEFLNGKANRKKTCMYLYFNMCMYVHHRQYKA